MKRNAGASIATLVRWRGFQESRASADYRQATATVERSVAALEQAQTRLQLAQLHRLDLLQSAQLDMARLQVSAGIEDVAHQQTVNRERELDSARGRQERTRADHLQARAHTKVAESRHAKVATREDEHAEKSLFDWMADLCTATRGRT